MPNVGSLARVALPEILKRVNAHELSGSLEATAGTIVRTIYFDRGFIVFTSSTSKSERLGQCLVKAGRRHGRRPGARRRSHDRPTPYR